MDLKNNGDGTATAATSNCLSLRSGARELCALHHVCTCLCFFWIFDRSCQAFGAISNTTKATATKKTINTSLPSLFISKLLIHSPAIGLRSVLLSCHSRRPWEIIHGQHFAPCLQFISTAFTINTTFNVSSAFKLHCNGNPAQKNCTSTPHCNCTTPALHCIKDRKAVHHRVLVSLTKNRCRRCRLWKLRLAKRHCAGFVAYSAVLMS